MYFILFTENNYELLNLGLLREQPRADLLVRLWGEGIINLAKK